ncbi:MAG TPA: methyltransferase domain-containing protein, partial [Solirubrobacteraceae bacterium]|nr:methyltransferase domain-containing protein [Solirubrobacteraceae bacterium]
VGYESVAPGVGVLSARTRRKRRPRVFAALAWLPFHRRNVLLGDVAEPLPFAEGRFDGVVVKDLLEHLDRPADLVSEVHRVLRPGGLVFASSPDAQGWVWDDYTHRRPYTRKSFRLLFADQGFEVLRVGYESVAPGVGVLSARTRRKRRPRVFAALAWLPFHRRNVWLLARRRAADGP